MSGTAGITLIPAVFVSSVILCVGVAYKHSEMAGVRNSRSLLKYRY